jgi:hypothetical protein
MTEATYTGKRCLACGFSWRDAKTHECTHCRDSEKRVARNIKPNDPRTFTSYGAFELSSDNGIPYVAYDAETGNMDIRLRPERGGAA